MNKEIYKIENIGTIKAITVEDESLTIDADKHTKIATEHDQDFCENVFGDFSISKYYEKELVGKTVGSLTLKRVEDMGFLLCFDGGYRKEVKIFIPCYNYQNGYYSSNLSVEITQDGTKTEVDISDCVEDHIN